MSRLVPDSSTESCSRISARVAACVAVAAVAAATVRGADAPRFESHVLPVFERNCIVCHGSDSPQAGLDLRSPEGLLKGGNSGPAILAGNSQSSLLVAKIASGSMPPGDVKLETNQIELIRQWIDEGIGEAATAEARLVTERDVLPVFQMRCVTCHGKRRQEAGLDLRTRESRLRGGKSGPAVVPGEPEQSLLLKRVVAGEMPPAHLLMEFNVRPPNSAEVGLLRQWIASGAPAAPEMPREHASLVTDADRSFWSFQRPERPAIPEVGETRLRPQRDRFIPSWRNWRRKVFVMPRRRNPPLCCARTYLDLIGLPPTPAEIERFSSGQTDQRPRAAGRPAARFGALRGALGSNVAGLWRDTPTPRASSMKTAFGRTPGDIVITSFGRLNSDKSYTRFLTEQIAGDELENYKEIDQVDSAGHRSTGRDGFSPDDAGPHLLFRQRLSGRKARRRCETRLRLSPRRFSV